MFTLERNQHARGRAAQLRTTVIWIQRKRREDIVRKNGRTRECLKSRNEIEMGSWRDTNVTERGFWEMNQGSIVWNQ